MRSVFKPVILILCLTLSGCGAIRHDYIWSEYPLTSNRISSQVSLLKGQELRIIKGKSDDSDISLYKIGPHQYYVNEQSLTNGIVDHLAKEMQKQGLEISNTAEKSLEIAVNHSDFKQGMWKIAATLKFTVKFGNGKTKSYTVRNSSPGSIDLVYNGAVALSVLEMINDPVVLAYVGK